MLRALAWRILRSGHPTPLRAVGAAAAEVGLDGRDRSLLRRLVATEVRRRATLHALVRRFATGRVDADLAAHLHLGFVQLFFLDQIPDHAAVSETVTAARETLGERAGRLVNSVLRKSLDVRASGVTGDPRRDLALRDVHFTVPVFHDPGEHPLLWAEEALSMPVALIKRWTKRYGRERAEGLAVQALEEPDLSLRVPARGGEREALVGELTALGCASLPGVHARILVVAASATEAVLHSEAFEAGRLTVQGESALRAADLVEARAGEELLELCAAPGGKSAVLAESGSRLLACDVDARRLQRARETLARLGVAERVDLVACDGARAVTGEFAGVLLDAPCSNTGVLAQRPEARWRFGSQSQRDLAALQERLLDEAAARVSPGGRLVYSTCSVEPEENQRRVRAFLERQPAFALAEEFEALPAPRGTSGPVDGGYAARLVRC